MKQQRIYRDEQFAAYIEEMEVVLDEQFDLFSDESPVVLAVKALRARLTRDVPKLDHLPV